MSRAHTGFLLLLALIICSCQQNSDPDMVIINGKIWTGNKQMPWAAWVSVKGGRILDVGKEGTTFPGKAGQTIDIGGRLMIPGFNDSHVHFASAGHLLLNINLLDVNTSDRFIDNVRQTTRRLPKGSWITGGDWGAYEAWAMGSSGGKAKATFTPNRDMIDSITSEYPVLVTRYDRKLGLANDAALKFLSISSDT